MFDFSGWKTFIGIAITAVAAFSQNMGYEVNVDFLNASLNSVFEVVGMALALYGRWKAETPIFKKSA